MSQKLEYELKGKSDVEQVTGRAKKSVETLGQSFKKAGDDIVKKFAGMFAGAVLFDKAVGFLTNTFSDLDQVADQIDRSGISSTQFQQLAWAAKMSGVELSVVAKATRQLRVDMAEAATGAGKKVEMFKALGISMEQLKSGDAKAVFLAISEAMGGTADDSERLLIATAFFGDTIGSNILPLLADFEKLQKDIANAPVVDEKTLKRIGEYNDGIDRLAASFQKLAANIFNAYDTYSKFVEKMAGGYADFVFNILEKVGLGDSAASILTGAIDKTPMGFALTTMGADGTKPQGVAAASSGDEAKKAAKTAGVLAAVKAAMNPDKDKAPNNISGNVIGVGQNPVIAAMQEQTEVAKQSLDYLRIIASQKASNVPSPDLTDKGATPVTPASRK